MNIVFLTRRFWPDRGGVEKHVYEISRILIKKGHSVSVVTESLGNKDVLDGIKIYRITGLKQGKRRKWLIWKWMIKNKKIFDKSDIVHAHDVYYQYLPLKLINLSKKSFVTFHGYETYPISKKAIIIRKISEKISDGNIIVGEFIRKWYKTNPDFIIYGGVNKPKKITKPDRLNSAVFIGRLDKHTGVLDYAKAIDELKTKDPKFEFMILGEGEYINRLKKYNPSGFIDDSISILNKYNFAFVSRYLSILEALVCKRLVFALYDNSIKEDYLKMTPFKDFIITADSSASLVRKIKFFQDNPSQVKKFVNKGFKWAKNQTWENVVDSYLKLWRKHK